MSGTVDASPSHAAPQFVWNYVFDGDGVGARAGWTEVQQARTLLSNPVQSVGWLWLHLSLSDGRSREFVSDLGLPQEVEEVLLAREEHLSFFLERDCGFGIFPDWHHETGDDLDTAVGREHHVLGYLHFAVSPRLLISARVHPLRTISDLRRRIDGGERFATSTEFLEAYVDTFAQTIARAGAHMTFELDHLEDRVLTDEVDDERRSLIKLRRQAVRLHRTLKGLHGVIRNFEQRYAGQSAHELIAASARISQRLDELDNEIVALQDRSRLLHDDVAAKIGVEMNRNLYVLSILTALLLPPTLVTGLFGMNVSGLPFADHDGNGFAWTILLAVAASAAVYAILRKLGILR